MANTTRTPALKKLFGKLRHIVVAPQDPNTPRRPWDSASAREIQLEFDLDTRICWQTPIPRPVIPTGA